MFGMESNRFFGRKILVTAGATPFGHAIALGLARRGADVLAVDTDSSRLSDLTWDSAGIIQTRTGNAAVPDEAPALAGWIRSDHANLAGLIACPDAAGNPASRHLVQRLTRLMRSNPDPFVGFVLPDETTALAALAEVPLHEDRWFTVTRLILPRGMDNCDHPALAEQALHGIDARTALVRLAARSASRRRNALHRMLVRASA
jgi:NAD(P)-dependent dehydrogenase (short-subunit alcohol dehydrogenase family)